MVIKVLFLNFPAEELKKIPSNVTITQATIEESPILHDFHVIIVDTDEILKKKWWVQGANLPESEKYTIKQLRKYSSQIQEHLETGGIVFCFSGSKLEKEIIARDTGADYVLRKYKCKLDNYFFCPVDLNVINETGDTFYLRNEELNPFESLFDQISADEISWKSYFKKIPKNARIIGVTRANYCVLMEVPLGKGKLILLPHFKNRSEAVTKIVNNIIPRLCHEEERFSTPKWLCDFSSDLENHTRETLRQLEKAKRLLYTKDSVLEKAVAFAFEKIGFKVKILPSGTLPDLELLDGQKKCIVEVKGHDNRQAKRAEILQLLGYLSETDVEEKGIVVCNHEFTKNPNKRNGSAFTTGAIQLGKNNGISLVSSIDLYEIVMKVLNNEIDDVALQKLRIKLMGASGQILFD